MKHYRKRPFTKRVLTCIKKSSLIEYMGERSHIVVDSNVLYLAAELHTPAARQGDLRATQAGQIGQVGR